MSERPRKGLDRRDLILASIATVGAAAALTANATAPYAVEYFTNSGVGNNIFASAGTSSTVKQSSSE